MASLWKHPKSKFWTACYTNREGKQVKRSTKQTKRKEALTVAMEWERVEQQVRQGTVSRLQIQKVFNDLAEKTTGDTIMTPSVEEYLKDCLTFERYYLHEADEFGIDNIKIDGDFFARSITMNFRKILFDIVALNR